MTREKQIEYAMKESVTETIYSSGYGFTRQATDLLECAWVKGAEWADRTMIDKACEWLKAVFVYMPNESSWNIQTNDYNSFQEMIEDFRKSMKGE